MSQLLRTYSIVWLLRVRTLLSSGAGNITFGAVFGFLILLIAYLTHPETFNHFFKYVLDLLFNNLHKAFPKGGTGASGVAAGTGTGK